MSPEFRLIFPAPPVCRTVRPRGLLAALLAGFGLAVFMACGFGQEVVIDAGTEGQITPDAVAVAYAWTLDGQATGATSRTYAWTPARRDVGTHWLKAELTLPGGAKTQQHWRVRVRIPIPAGALTFYVATDGSDDNAGTIGEPFETLERARDAVRALGRPLPEGGVTVFVRGGTYRRTATFNLTAADSGTEGAPVVYRAYGTEAPVFTTARIVPATGFTALDAAMVPRVVAGVSASNIRQLDLAALGLDHDGPFPTRFNQNRLYNPYHTSQDGGIFELFFNGARVPLSRYPNDNLTDRFATTCLKMDGVTQKYSTYLNGQAIGGQFKYKTADGARIQRWQTAAAEGQLWLQGFWRVPWEEYGMKVKTIDAAAGTFTMASGASLSLGYGNKYFAYEGSKSEPYWALNLLEEIDQAGEWAIDFVRKRLYFWPPAAIADGSVEISDFGLPVFKLTGTSHVVLQGLQFDRTLAQGIVVSGGDNNLIAGCDFRRTGSYGVDLYYGESNGVVSCDFDDLSAGGIVVRGGDEDSSPRTPCDHFVVNNDIQNFGKVVKIYGAAIDAGFGGQSGAGGGGGHLVCVGARIAHNRIAQTHHVGILHGSYDKVFEYNDISNFCRTNGDMGGIYSFQSSAAGGYETARFNLILNKSYAWETYFPYHSIGGTGIQVDGMCYGSRMSGNIIEVKRYGIGISNGDSGSVFNNLIFNCGKAATTIGGAPAVFRTNASALGKTAFGGNATGTNKTYTADPGTIGRASNDYRLKPSSTVYKDLTLFQEIPVEMIGLYKDEIRTSAPAYKPVIDAPAGATNITQTTATLNARLDFPFINPDTTVRVYWGTVDCATTASAWQNSMSLGFRTRGTLEAAVAGLAQKTKYYYRFYASNAGGSAWTGTTRSFTTAGTPSTKADNAADLSTATSWTNGTVPAGGLAVWNSSVTGGSTVSIGTGLSLLGIQVTDPGGNVTVTPGTGSPLTLGSGGLDLSGSNRTLTLEVPVVLAGDQTWTTGTSGTAGSVQITASGAVSGPGELRVAGAAGRAVALTGTNAFAGGFVLEAGGSVTVGTSGAVTTNGTLSFSPLGIGTLTINGGTVGSTGAFAFNAGIANPQIFVNDDFQLHLAGRMMIAGAWDLGGGTRTVSCTRVVASGSAIQAGGNTSWGIGSVAGLSSIVANGNLRVVRDPAAAANFVSFRINSSPAFSENAGLMIGPGVISTLAAALSNADATKLADLTVEAGGYFGLCENETAFSASVGSLAGDGEVGNFSRSAGATTATLTINGGAREDRAEFSGRIVDGDPALYPVSVLGKVNVVKSGATTQVLSGNNTYSGTTTISGGTLEVNGRIASTAALAVASGARLAGGGTIASPVLVNGTLEPTGVLTFTGSLSLASTGRLVWNLSANQLSGAPVIAGQSVTVAAGASIQIEATEAAGTVRFSDPFWTSARTFPLITGTAVTGDLAPGPVSADSAGNSHEAYGSFGLENTGTAINLVWLPLGSVEGWRFKNFGTIADAGDAADAADPDADSFTNAQERGAATDPNDPGDFPGFRWTGTGGPAAQPWSTSANWAGAQVPDSASNRRLDFLSGLATTAGNITSSNDLPGTFALNRLVLGGANPSGTTVFSLAGNPLLLSANGATGPRVDLEAAAGFTCRVVAPVTLGAMVSVRRTGDGHFVLAGPIDGAGGLAFEGDAGTITLLGNNTYSGGTSVAAGTLQVGNDGTSGSVGTGPLVLDGLLRIDRAGALAIPGAISGTGSLAIYNPEAGDIVTLSGSNSFLGSVTVGGGGLRVAHSNALGTGAKSINVQTSTTGSLRLDGSSGNLTLPAALTLNLSNPNGVLVNEAGDNRINGAINLTAGAGPSAFTVLAGSLTLAGKISPAATGRTLELRGAGQGILGGNLTNGSGNNTLAGLVKSDSGTWTLAGTGNNFGGTTTVNAGTLDITGNATCSGGLTVAAGGTFSGTAAFASASSIDGRLVPGLITFSSPLAFGAGSALVWKTTGNAYGTSGRVIAQAVGAAPGARIDLQFDAPGSKANFLHAFWRTARTWTLVSSASGLLTGNFTLGNISNDSAGHRAADFGSFSLQQSATGVLVAWTPIGGVPSYTEPLVARVAPLLVPAATADLSHSLRVAASATGGGNMTWVWTLVSGPGTAAFEEASASATFVSFGVAGRYVLRATATNEVGSGFVEITVDAAPPARFTLRQGVDGYSHPATFLRADSVDWNSGVRDQLLAGKTAEALRTVLSFSVSTVPRTWPVSAVSLDLWTHPVTAGSGTIGNLHLRRMTRSFLEGSGDGNTSTSGAGTGATWAKFNTVNSWTTPGGDFDPSALATLAGYDATARGAQRTFGPTVSLLDALAASMSANSSLNLVVLAPATETANATNVYTRFASDDHPTESVRPRLTISFSHNLTPAIQPGTAPAATARMPAALAGSVSDASSTVWSLVAGPGEVAFADASTLSTTATFSRPGLHVLRLSASNASGESSRLLSIQVAGTDPARFADWQDLTWPGITDPGIIGPAADPDSDGVPNLIEWALATDPMQGDRRDTTISAEGGHLIFRYIRRKTAPGEIQFQVEWSDSLAAPWTTSGVVSDPPVSLDASTESVRSTIPLPVAGRRFVRLQLSIP